MDEPISVGILCEPYLYEWHVRALETLENELDVRIPLVVSNARNRDCELESWNDRKRVRLDDFEQFYDAIRREGAWSFVLAERTLARILGDEQQLWHRHTVDTVACLENAAHVRCDPSMEKGWFEFPDEIVTRVAADCDVVVLFGFGLIRGAILNAPEYGILSFHPADIRSYRGMGPPPMFHDGAEIAGTTLQQLDESIDGGKIVAYDDVDISDCYTLWDVFDRIVRVQIELLTNGISAVTRPDFEPTTVPTAQLGDLYYRETRRTVGFSGRILLNNLLGRTVRQTTRLSRHLSRLGSGPGHRTN
ncbi:methionyl-tRNA formyltransferase [Natrarchaeobius halalkaliphilus]|uniref:phosphoribosylglycinamide formyltransferase 1 n=1 Tax=Natrarchaeobius halalkaliphilus TaxID=1679091 RepID=A0A3N6LK99_9EURY|nr:formyltransferase family protein [Natrarchaeobius halalkaliphilus]RQG86808.1 methionyl-tRNA formyltransferase [Natrarchaeobius halalkaliphilus]